MGSANVTLDEEQQQEMENNAKNIEARVSERKTEVANFEREVEDATSIRGHEGVNFKQIEQKLKEIN